MTNHIKQLCFALVVFVQSAWAVPVMRVIVPDELKNPIWVSTGTNGPSGLIFEVTNDGDGALAPTVSGGFSPWLTPTIGGPLGCIFDFQQSGRQVRVSFASAGLAAGTYEGEVIISDPGAANAPQTVPIKIFVGGNVPDRVDFYVRPVLNSSDFAEFQTAAGPAPTIRADVPFVRVTSTGLMSFRSDFHGHKVTATYQAGQPIGDQNGTLAISGSSVASDNGDVPITMHITDGPIANPSSTRLRFTMAAGLAVGDQFVGFSNRGAGALAVTALTASTDNGGAWLSTLSTEDAGNNLFRVKAAIDGLAAGQYTGRLAVTSNAPNAITIEVTLVVQPLAGPIISHRGVVNGATFANNRPLTPGLITSIFGIHLANQFALAGALPLPTDFNGTRIVIDGIDSPLFFESFGQLNFQVPWEVGNGDKLVQVFRDGQAGNQALVPVAGKSPGIFRLNIAQYGAIRNASQNNFPMPTALGQSVGIAAAPARPGDVLEIFATGLGAVSPSAPTGAGAPAGPLATALEQPEVQFGFSFPAKATPLFAGLTPGFVGLFQINVIVPVNVATNNRTFVTLNYPDGQRSNTVEIAISK